MHQYIKSFLKLENKILFVGHKHTLMPIHNYNN